ncbi:hypothetical protein BH09ACT12_BH09ACT12_16600 [soil metagenome]
MTDESNLPMLRRSHGPGLVVLTAGFAVLLVGLGVFGVVRAITIDHTTRTALTSAFCQEVSSSGDGGKRQVCLTSVTSGDGQTEVEVDEDTLAGDEVRVELKGDGTVSSEQSRLGLLVASLLSLGIGGCAALVALSVGSDAFADDPLRSVREVRYRLRPR